MNEKKFYEESAEKRYLHVDEYKAILGKQDMLRKINSEIHKNMIVFDAGCGDGLVTDNIRKVTGAKIFGGDISSKALEICKKKGIQNLELNFNKDLPFKENSFDIVICLGVLEHLFNPKIVLDEFKRILKQHGKLILLVPNAKNIIVKLKFLFSRLDRNVFVEGHLHVFTPEKIKTLLEKKGYSVCKITSFKGNTLKSKIISIFPMTFGQFLLIFSEKI